MGKKSGSGSGINNPDRISITIFWVNILKFFDADPGRKTFGSGIRDGKNSDLGSAINIPDPQHRLLTRTPPEIQNYAQDNDPN
jgi:hypothetical protein